MRTQNLTTIVPLSEQSPWPALRYATLIAVSLPFSQSEQVEIAFECYRTGQYQYPTVPFNKKEAGDRSDGFYKDTVKGFIMKPEEYDVFLEKVRPFVDRLTPGKSAQHASKRRRRTMGSSPPPESD